ncbi:MAG: hypothetical protein IJX90_08340 [Blautia sp.]|nr:hypothetical protein [Blautia sp.]
MNERSSGSFVTIGIPSILVIFAVLTMVTLSLMSLGNARSDLKASQTSIEVTGAYYDAGVKATDLYKKTEAYVIGAMEEASDEAAYLDALGRISETIPEITWSRESALLSFSVPYSDTQSLFVAMSAPYAGAAGDPYLSILNWSSVTTGQWNPDQHMNLFSGTLPVS